MDLILSKLERALWLLNLCPPSSQAREAKLLVAEAVHVLTFRKELTEGESVDIMEDDDGAMEW